MDGSSGGNRLGLIEAPLQVGQMGAGPLHVQSNHSHSFGQLGMLGHELTSHRHLRQRYLSPHSAQLPGLAHLPRLQTRRANEPARTHRDKAFTEPEADDRAQGQQRRSACPTPRIRRESERACAREKWREQAATNALRQLVSSLHEFQLTRKAAQQLGNHGFVCKMSSGTSFRQRDLCGQTFDGVE